MGRQTDVLEKSWAGEVWFTSGEARGWNQNWLKGFKAPKQEEEECLLVFERSEPQKKHLPTHYREGKGVGCRARREEKSSIKSEDYSPLGIKKPGETNRRDPNCRHGQGGSGLPRKNAGGGGFDRSGKAHPAAIMGQVFVAKDRKKKVGKGSFSEVAGKKKQSQGREWTTTSNRGLTEAITR